jgi:hemerythrin-like domain-containing protein
MNTATAILRQEHDAILRMLDVTDAIVQQLERNQRVAPETLAGLLEFFRLFADRCHHGKEEELLFPLLERKGMAHEGGPIGVMLHEHEQGRSLVRQMGDAADAYGSGQAQAGARWADAARSYVALLRQHIDKENNVLFMMAENVLSAAEQAELVAAFEKVEEEKMGAGTHERLHALMDKLCAEVLSA